MTDTGQDGAAARARTDWLGRDRLPPVPLPRQLPPWRPPKYGHDATSVVCVRRLWRQAEARPGQVCAVNAVVRRQGRPDTALAWDWEVRAAIAWHRGTLLWARARTGSASGQREAKTAATRAARAWAAAPYRLHWTRAARTADATAN